MIIVVLMSLKWFIDVRMLIDFLSEILVLRSCCGCSWLFVISVSMVL